ncbi:MAG: endonuclease NucS domain-containing protein [Dehalococcoidia bacterium]
MTKKMKIIDIKEKEDLEPMLAEDLSLVEDGMVLLGQQVQTDSGPLDILAVDSDGALVVIELKSIVDENHLMQGLRYYDWVASNASWIANAHKDKGIDPKETCRLLLVAPGFDETTKKIAKYINVDLDLIDYTCVELPDSTRSLICRRLSIPIAPEPPKIYSIPDKLKRIQDEKIRELCKEAIEYMNQKGIETRPINAEWISCWYKNKRFMYLGCKKHFFVCEVLHADGDWSNRMRISTKKEWDEIMKGEIHPACQRIAQGTQPGTISSELPSQQ